MWQATTLSIKTRTSPDAAAPPNSARSRSASFRAASAATGSPIRADEDRGGYISTKPNITTVYPFKEEGLVRRDIIQILEESGLGLPKYTEWGRTRSGCFFCFFQQKIEWVRLKEKYPEKFEEAKGYEYAANKGTGQPFYWCGDEPLVELEKPERVEEIKRKWADSQERQKKASKKRLLLHILGDSDHDEDGEKDGCLICHV
jgi:hypothetical protein